MIIIIIQKQPFVDDLQNSCFLVFVLPGIHSMGFKSLRAMELQDKEAQKDYSIQEICLERTYS